MHLSIQLTKKYITIVLSILAIIVASYIGMLMLQDSNKVEQNTTLFIKSLIPHAEFAEYKTYKYPYPYTTIHNLATPQIKAKKITIKWPILSHTIAVTIDRVEIRNMNNTNKTLVHLAKHLLSLNLPNINLHITNISMLNSQDALIEHLNSIHLVGYNKSYHIDCEADLSRTMAAISEDEKGISISLDNQGPTHSLKMSIKGNNALTGTMNAEIRNLSQFISTYYNDVDLLLTHVASEEKVIIQSNISGTLDALTFNSKITSPSINGEAAITINQSSSDSINIHFDKVNLTEIIAPIAISHQRKSYESPILYLQDFDIQLVAAIDQLIIQNDVISNITLEGATNAGNFDIKNMQGNLPQGGKFIVYGQISQNAYRSVFDGQLYITHPNAAALFHYEDIKQPVRSLLTANIRATAFEMQLYDILAEMNDISINGTCGIKFISGKPKIDSMITIKNLLFEQIQNYPLLTDIAQYIYMFTDTKNKDYANKFTPLRNLQYTGNFDVSFTDLAIKNHKMDRLNTVVELFDNEINFSSIYYQKGENFFTGNGRFIVSGLKPQIFFNTTSGNITFSSDIETILNFKKNVVENIDLNKIDLKSNITLDAITYNKVALSNFEANFANNRLLINIEHIKGKILDGLVESRGQIVLHPLSLSIGYAVNNINLAKLPNTILPTLDGEISSNGVLSTHGETMEEVLYYTYVNSKVTSKNIVIQNIGIDDLISKITSPGYKIRKLSEDLQAATTTGKTNLKSLDGTYKIMHGVLESLDTSFISKTSAGSAALSMSLYNQQLNMLSIINFYPSQKQEPISIKFRANGQASQPSKAIEIDEKLIYAIQMRPS